MQVLLAFIHFLGFVLVNKGTSVAAVHSATTPEVKAGVLKGEYDLVFFYTRIIVGEKMEGCVT